MSPVMKKKRTKNGMRKKMVVMMMLTNRTSLAESRSFRWKNPSRTCSLQVLEYNGTRQQFDQFDRELYAPTQILIRVCISVLIN